MSKETLTNQILEYAVNGAISKFPKTWGSKNDYGLGLDEPLDINTFYGSFISGLVKNGANADGLKGVSDDQTRGSRTIAFATSVLSNLFLTDALCDSIDNFFYDEKNNQLFNEMSDRDKEDFRHELKDKVKNDLAVQANTKKGQDLVDKLTVEFDRLITFKEDRATAQKAKEDNGFDAYIAGAELMDDGMSALYALNYNLGQGMTISQSAQAVRENSYSYLCELILDSFENDWDSPEQEKHIFSRYAETFYIQADNSFDVNPTKFVENYKAGTVTEQEKAWAADIFERKMGMEDIDFKFLKLNGNSMFPHFDEGNLNPETKKDMAVDVVAAALTGNQVSIMNGSEEKMLSPYIEGAVKEPEMGFLEKLIQTIKKFLGMETKPTEMQKISEMNSANISAKTAFREKTVDCISFNELAGINALKKVTDSSQKQDTLSVEKNGASKGK